MKRLTYKRGDFWADPNEVLYIIGNGDGPYSNLHLTNGDIILTCRSSKWYNDRWSNFLKIHKTVTVNQDFILWYKVENLRKSKKLTIVMDHSEFEVARRRTMNVLSTLTTLNILRINTTLSEFLGNEMVGLNNLEW